MRVLARLKYKMFYFFAVSLMFFSLSCSFLVPDSCWATVRNSNSIYAYKRGLHIIQNNKNDACFCSFWTIWQCFGLFFIYLKGGGYLSVSTNWLWYWFDFDLLFLTPLSVILQLYSVRACLCNLQKGAFGYYGFFHH
jgi:hypothetical protein